MRHLVLGVQAGLKIRTAAHSAASRDPSSRGKLTCHAGSAAASARRSTRPSGGRPAAGRSRSAHAWTRISLPKARASVSERGGQMRGPQTQKRRTGSRSTTGPRLIELESSDPEVPPRPRLGFAPGLFCLAVSFALMWLRPRGHQ